MKNVLYLNIVLLLLIIAALTWSLLTTDVAITFIKGAPGDFPWEDIYPDWRADFLYWASDIFEYVRDILL